MTARSTLSAHCHGHSACPRPAGYRGQAPPRLELLRALADPTQHLRERMPGDRRLTWGLLLAQAGRLGQAQGERWVAAGGIQSAPR